MLFSEWIFQISEVPGPRGEDDFLCSNLHLVTIYLNRGENKNCEYSKYQCNTVVMSSPHPIDQAT